MDRRPENSPMTHFHIRWSQTGRLDWERFDSREEAKERVLEIAHPMDSFKVEECDRTCAACRALSFHAQFN